MGRPLTNPADLKRLQHFSDGDVVMIVPRELLITWGPKEMDRVPYLIEPAEFGELFRNFEHSAWRLETRRGYASDLEDDSYIAFKATGSATWDLGSPWSVNMRAQTAQGKTVGRVRIVDDPPTTGQLFLLDYAQCNAATGEDIRNLWRADAERLHLGDEDFWIFDSRLVAVLHFDDNDVLLNIELTTEPAEVVRYSVLRDAAMHHAVAFEQFAAQLIAKQ
ncbi:DUF6879 family protein [Streptomyces sp. CBMA152]|uniref:DUF6879 family protein n=1 Tax=Streptomyces sp. CBMA152 TaxID=1896312 RepID=UPI002948B9FF|nr:DUF6879 family protein [Streptomyces sp. CBMA152]MBD0746402.1 hypothetical protein [Streptomyces sp. CBMA152]